MPHAIFFRTSIVVALKSDCLSTFRAHSYTDRILWKSADGLAGDIFPLFYEPCPGFVTSDHKPIRGGFNVTTISGCVSFICIFFSVWVHTPRLLSPPLTILKIRFVHQKPAESSTVVKNAPSVNLRHEMHWPTRYGFPFSRWTVRPIHFIRFISQIIVMEKENGMAFHQGCETYFKSHMGRGCAARFKPR